MNAPNPAVSGQGLQKAAQTLVLPIEGMSCASCVRRVEMEALTAVQVGLLTIYDMCKAVDRGMVMEGVRLLEKRSGMPSDSP